MYKHDKYRANAIFGAISGSAQAALGFAHVNAKYRNADIPTGIHIGVGLTTLVTSIVRLVTKNPPKENNVTLNFMYFQDRQSDSSILGRTLKKIIGKRKSTNSPVI